MIPLHDDNPTVLPPIVTVGLIALCGLVFIWQLSLGSGAAERAVYAFGMVPAVLLGTASLPADIAVIPAQASVVTSMFLHGGWLHLLGNMLYLWIFGNNIEDATGHVRFIVFYLLCGTAAALSQAFQDPASTVPMIGASGAISGVLGGYAMLFPRAHVLVLLPIGFFITPLRVPALLVLGLWFVLQFIYSAATVGQPGGVAHWAHIGGFIAGVILIVPFRNKAFPLFGGPHRQVRGRGPFGDDSDRQGRPPRGPWG